MPRRVTDLIQNIKTSCDPDTLLFHFKGTAMAEAFNRQVLNEPWPTLNDEGINVLSDDDTYYQRLIMPRITNEMALNIFYKNLNGVWVNYHKCVLSYPRIAIQVAAVTYEEYVKVDITNIPPCIYMGNEHFVHYIDEHDGTYPDYRLPIIDIDESTEGKVSYSPYSLEEPNLPFAARHIMTDLRVKVKDTPPDNLLVWLNGIFVPTIRDDTYEDVFYIKNAMTAIGSKCINQKLHAPWNHSGKNATVKEDEEFNEYRMDARFRFFSWKNVKVSRWFAPLSIEKVPIIHNYSSINIIKKIIFPEVINKNAHMILDNGIILDPEEYIIDPYDQRKITLKYVETSAYRLLNEMIKDINENVDVYVGMKPLTLIETALVNRTYSLINFSSPEETETKKLYLKRSIACATDFPYKSEITFPDIALGDLVTVNGTYNEYEWVHNHTIGYPLFRYTYNGDEARIHENDVKRLYFICK